MTNLRQAAEMALEALESSQESGSVGVKIDNAITALRQALDQLFDTTKMIEPEELVCVCGSIWQGQEMICPPRCLDEGIEREMPTDRGAWSDVEDATKWVDELRGDDDATTALRQALEQPRQECETCANKRKRLEQSGFLKFPLKSEE